MMDKHERLREERKKAGFASAADAARALGVGVSTYRHHENGTRDFESEEAAQYAKRFRSSTDYLLYGRKPSPQPPAEARHVPLVGYVGAGAETYFTANGELGEVEAPAGSTESTVAVEIRGDSLGAFFDRWLVYYDDVRRPVTADLVGRLCVIGLEDGRILIKKVQRSRTRGLFHLLSQTSDPPILDVAIEWAAKVKNMVPR